MNNKCLEKIRNTPHQSRPHWTKSTHRWAKHFELFFPSWNSSHCPKTEIGNNWRLKFPVPFITYQERKSCHWLQQWMVPTQPGAIDPRSNQTSGWSPINHRAALSQRLLYSPWTCHYSRPEGSL